MAAPGTRETVRSKVGFASQKNFIGLYIVKADVMNAHLELLKVKGVSLGKGCIRYSKPEKIDFEYRIIWRIGSPFLACTGCVVRPAPPSVSCSVGSGIRIQTWRSAHLPR